MNTIFSHIEYLLYSHDCVIVPQLGAFMVRNVPAEFNEVSSTFLPPRRQIIFNPELTHSDGLLAASVARKNQINYTEAAAIVTDEVTKILAAVARPESRCRAGHLGLLMRAPHGVLVFEPARRYFTTPMLYGLSSIAATTVAEREEAEAHALRGKRLSFTNIMRVAASILLLIAIGFLTTTPLPLSNSNMHLASLSFPKITLPEENVTDSAAAEIEFNIAAPNPTDGCTVITPEELAQKLNPVSIDNSHPYYLVVASVDTPEQANRFISQHPAINLQIIKHQYTYRVIAATATTAAQLTELHKNRLATEFPQAWPCHR